MKLRLMDYLVCPSCETRFTLRADRTEQRQYTDDWRDRVRATYANERRADCNGDFESLWKTYCTEILSGQLSCDKCGAAYPIEGGIPRILPPDLRTVADRMGRGDPRTDTRIDHEMDEIAPVRADQDGRLFDQIQKANQSNYGYEWKAFSHEYDSWDAVYRENYVKEQNSFFFGKLGLDAGCGMARYTRVPVRQGAEMIGLDLSNAIEAAYSRGRELPTFHAVQGDIFNLPFRNDCFDFAQSLGVIHITPDPEGALQSIICTVRPDSKIFLMVYQTFEEQSLLKHVLLKPVTLMRRLTVQLPSDVLYGLLYGMVPVVLTTCYWPSWLLWHIPGGKKLSSKLPYNYEQYASRRFRDIHMNLFDRFGNPVERRYRRCEMEAWMARAGFRSFELWSKDGWLVTGIKAPHRQARAA